MKKKSSFSTRGQRADIGDLEIYRMLPNRYADAVVDIAIAYRDFYNGDYGMIDYEKQRAAARK